ncbi:class I SAM-dependent methyltransferase [Streptomyces sp. NBC_00344]|uniref:class I SAM-dependent methyltransferase n=1 Tax=Streptomyces sp. NBC_00344 TaxID=2975720 RepID=UPI002E1A948A
MFSQARAVVSGNWAPYAPEGPTFRELTVQALSSIERGYDLLAPKFDRTPFRTSDRLLDAVAGALLPLGPFEAGLDVCCGTGAGVRTLRSVCAERVTGVDFSAGMLAAAAQSDLAATGTPVAEWVRADARALPFRGAFDLAVSFGAFGHFLPAERPGLFAEVHRSLRPGGVFAFPIGAPMSPRSSQYWTLLGFDAVMRVRNLVWRPQFVMYYRTFPLAEVCEDLIGAGFSVGLVPLEEFGRRADGSPRCRLVMARRE